MHGGVAKDHLASRMSPRLKRASSILAGISKMCASSACPCGRINNFTSDTAAEHALIEAYCRGQHGVDAVVCSHWRRGRKAPRHWRIVSSPLPKAAIRLISSPFNPDSMPLFDKVSTIAREIYRASEVTADKKIRDQLREWETAGLRVSADLRSQDPDELFDRSEPARAPDGPYRADPRGQPFSRCGLHRGDMRGNHAYARLPKVPSAEKIYIDARGQIEGLF